MSQFKNISIEKIQDNELPIAAELLTDAFETNPAYALIFNKTSKIREGLYWLCKANLFLMNRQQTITRVIKEEDTGRIIGVFSVVPPGGIKTSFTDNFRVGLPYFIRRFGFGTLVRMLRMNAFNKELLNRSMQTDSYYYLSMVALREECRGKGIGSYAISQCLDELSAEKKDCSLLGLTTQLPENVIFYSRLGFIKMDEATVSFQDIPYYNCNMKYNL